MPTSRVCVPTTSSTAWPGSTDGVVRPPDDDPKKSEPGANRILVGSEVLNMNVTRHSLRTVVAVGAGLALTLAACGGDDDSVSTPSATEDDTSGGATADPPTQPASITFDAQDSDGTTITIAAAELPADGFIAVHGDGGGSPGPVIGVSELIRAGTSTDVVITLDAPLEGDTTLYPMVHIDTNGNGIYEFGSVEGVDGPGVTAAGDVAVVGGAVTLIDGGGAADAGNTITIADFAFSGVTEVAVGTTIVVTNTDASPHTWSADGGSFDSGALSEGDTFEFTFTEAGEFAYHCNFHPSMTGTIVVTG